MKLTTLLEQFGFNEKEANVYLACLELGQAPASTIAHKLGEDRTTVYSCLQILVKKKVVSTIVKNNVTQFSAISPKQLLLHEQLKVDTLGDHLHTLIALSSLSANQPNLQYYE